MSNDKLIVPKSHIALHTARDISDICTPLLQQTPIKFVNYVRYYKNNTVIMLSNSDKYVRSTLSDLSWHIFDWDGMKALVQSNNKKLSLTTQQSHWLVEDIVPEELFRTYTTRFNLLAGLEIVEQFNDFYELFWFDSDEKNKAIHFYINNFDVIIKFIFYFRDKASKIIQQHERSKIIIPNRDEELKEFLFNLIDNNNARALNIKKLHDRLKLKKYQFNYKGEIAYITAREYECLSYLAKGFSVKFIASRLGLSSRTVESYLENLKNRLNCYSKQQLISVLHSSVFPQMPLLNTKKID